MEPSHSGFAGSEFIKGALAIAAPIACSLSLIAALLVADATSAQEATEKIWPALQWTTSTPEDQGMDSAEVAKLVAFGKAHSFDSLLIARHGRVVLDAYYAPYTADIAHAINSLTKAIIGTLIAIAHKDPQPRAHG